MAKEGTPVNLGPNDRAMEDTAMMRDMAGIKKAETVRKERYSTRNWIRFTYGKIKTQYESSPY